MRCGSRKNIPRPGLVVLIGLCCLYTIRKIQLLSNRALFSNQLQYPWAKRKNDTQQYILATIRIPKTGSTSLLTFLEKESGMTTLDTLLPSDVVERNNIQRLLCIYGPQPPNHTKVKSSKRAQCAHYKYKQTQDWIHEEMTHNDSIGSIHASLETITIVRDPFDRMQSLFYYVRKSVNTSQGWKSLFTESHYEMIRSGDFFSWMKVLAINRTTSPALQFEYLDDNVDTAISMLDWSNITVFLNECFEVSLRLMEDMYALRPGAVDAFLDSNSNLNKGTYNKTPERLAELREQSKLYFPNEYKFYDAAVERFKHLMSSSKVISPQLMQECLYAVKGDEVRHAIIS